MYRIDFAYILTVLSIILILFLYLSKKIQRFFFLKKRFKDKYKVLVKE